MRAYGIFFFHWKRFLLRWKSFVEFDFHVRGFGGLRRELWRPGTFGRACLRGLSQRAPCGRFAKCREDCVTRGFMCCSRASPSSTQTLARGQGCRESAKRIARILRGRIFCLTPPSSINQRSAMYLRRRIGARFSMPLWQNILSGRGRLLTCTTQNT